MKTVFDNPEELNEKILAYFDGLRKDPDGDLIQPPTLSGLALYLGVTRRTLANYIADAEREDGQKPNKKRSAQCAHLIMLAKAQMEQYLEEQLLMRSKTHGVEFALQNGYGWGQKQTVDVKSDVKAEVKTEATTVSKLSDEELIEQLKIMNARVDAIMEREGLTDGADG